MTPEKVNKINSLIRQSKLRLPDFRKTVSTSGKNVQWLMKNISKSNESVPAELIELLNNFFKK